MLDRPLVFLDLETTGATADIDRITEVGLVVVDRGECLGEWSSLVNPERIIPPDIEQLTGITNAMVEHAPVFSELAEDLFARLADRVLVAHNARFDCGFLRNEFMRAGLNYRPKVLCTVKLSRRLFPGERSHSLDSVIARHGLACATRHRALADARVLWDFTRQIYLDLDHAAICSVVESLLKGPSIPACLPPDLLDHLPEGPGVYLFYGENDVPLYVGKGVNIRARVMSHFSNDHQKAKDVGLATDVRRLDHIETAGELGALFREAQLVKRLLPVHNRKPPRNLATSRSRIESWPFPGRIGVKETHRATGRSEIHLLDQWCHLGTADTELDLWSDLESTREAAFDFETYRILTRYFKKHRAVMQILTFPGRTQ